MLKQFNMSCSISFFLFFILLTFLSYNKITITAYANINIVNIGAIVDIDSRAGKEQETAIKIAVHKFNTSSSINHKFVIHFLNFTSNRDPFQVASSAEKLIKEKQVEVLIIGTDIWAETALVANIGNRAKIPVISFSATDNDNIMPSLAQLQWPFLVQMSTDISNEISCIAAMVHSYNWRRVIVVYENNAFGGQSRHFIPLSDALHSIGSEIEHRLVLPRLTSLSDEKEILREEIAKVLAKQSRVFIVLESSLPMAIELFKEAKQLGLMGKDSVWILMEGVSSLLDSVNSSVFMSMQGALGIKTYYSEDSQPFLDFKARFREVFRLDHPEEDSLDPEIHAIRAYDSVTAISQSINGSKTLLNGILSSNFSGLSGQIRFQNGKLSDSPTFGILNIIGKSYKELGFWSSKYGFNNSLDKDSVGQSMKELTTLINWPGDLNRDPKGWAMPTITNKMKIGVPGNTSFEKFVKVSRIESSNESDVTGFCIDVFKAVIDVLEKEQGYILTYDFIPFYGSYDELVNHVYDKTYDAVVGDVTILAERSEDVEFTQPFTESGLSMVVPVRVEPYKTWKFMRPFTNEMWLASSGIMVYTMFVIWFMEHQTNDQFRGPWKDQLVTALWFTFCSLFFAHKEKIQSNYSKVVVMMWLFVVFILTSSYTASLTSMLTVRMLEPTVPNIEWLRRTNATVGCDPDSFVGKYLQDVLLLENIKYVYNQKEYPDKFKSGEITAAFLELPYLKVFLKEYCNKYMSTGPTYRFGGQGFVFQKGSPLVNDVSQAILTLSERGKLQSLENEWFNSTISCSDSNSGLDSERLKLDSFLGLFIISAVISTICFLLFLMKLLRIKVRELENYSGTTVISNESRWRKAIRLILIVLRLHNRGNVFPSNDEVNFPRWELVSPSEIPGHMGIVPRPTEIEIPVRTELHQNV